MGAHAETRKVSWSRLTRIGLREAQGTHLLASSSNKLRGASEAVGFVRSAAGPRHAVVEGGAGEEPDMSGASGLPSSKRGYNWRNLVAVAKVTGKQRISYLKVSCKVCVLRCSAQHKVVADHHPMEAATKTTCQLPRPMWQAMMK